ncbi:signal peptidase I [Polaromonas sp.]|nr:signal peptidase I [Candidatus Saccharibacteria bacterium]
MRLQKSVLWFLQGLAISVLLGLSTLLVLISWTIHHHHIRIMGVQTGSMSPSLKVGDAVVVQPVSAKSLALGDIVSYRPVGQTTLISHRIIAINTGPQRIIVKGDHNPTADTAISDSQVVGRTFAVLPHLGTANRIVRSPTGLVICVYLPLTYCLTREIRRLQAYRLKPYRVTGYTNRLKIYKPMV